MKLIFVCCLLFFLFAVAGGVARAQSPDSTALPALPDSLPGLARWPSSQLRQLAVDLSGHALAFKASFSEQSSQAVQQRRQAEQTLKTARLDTTLTKSRLREMEDSLKVRRTTEREAGKNRKRALLAVDLAARVQAMDSVTQRRNLPRLFNEIQALRALLPPPPEPAMTSVPEPGMPQQDTAVPPPLPTDPADSSAAIPSVAMEPAPVTRTAKKFKGYDPEEDVMANPPRPACVLAVNTRDEFSGETRRELQRVELFRHTKPGAKTTPRGQPHLTCEAALSSSGPTFSLNLLLTVFDPGTRKTFGGLSRNSTAILKFLDGTTFTVYNLRGDDGVANPAGAGTLFRSQFPLDKTVLKKIRSTGLDKIRLAWNNGYEDYEVHHVDLLKHQIRCLTN